MNRSVTTNEWLRDLKTNEDRSIVRGFGSLAFLRAQGRTLQRGSQEKMLDLLWAIRSDLDSIMSKDDFDERHRLWIERTVKALRTNRQKQLAHGQAQKTINVFLKFYVDWASRPTADAAARLRPWLHCPLDSVVMKALKARYTETWRRRIWEPHYRGRISWQRLASMSTIDESAYQAWQAWIRELSPDKPVLVDAIWSLDRPI